ncbi:hypothetical protein SLEP1_g41007 [Rubroshorea leprosula]|uniref:CCHC-type domain-containing protein n=1 Tax=Rubroshorea leprosula TaxID=152421 RepID=A0AAV5L6G4_9ROSI|nr:hypothetical protein SLEP1_g41007 [Rubroshorea leprosula]
MRSFLKGRKLWLYITGDITLPHKVTDETDKEYVDHLEDWDSKNHQIITWFRNTSIPSIHLQFGRYETTKEVWDLLAARYTTSDLSNQYQLWEELHNLKQERGESITSFYAKMEAIWDQLALSKPTFNDTIDIGEYIEYRDKMRLIQFLMELVDDFEPCKASLLYQSPLPTLDSALSRLLSDETHLGLLKPQRDTTMAVAVNKFPSSKRGQKYCRHCNKCGHAIYECSLVECHKCKQKGHIAPNCTTSLPQRCDQWKTQSKPDQSSKPVVVAVAANEDTSVHPSIGNLETLLRQMISSSSTSTALPTIPGKVSWIFDSGCCNHITSNSTLCSTLTPNTITPPIHIADGSQMQVSQYDQVSTSTFTLPNTFLILKLTFNLISVGQLCELRLELIFSTHGCRMQDPQMRQILGTSRKVGRLFELTFLQIPSSYISQLYAVSTSSSLHLWHLRLGHDSISKLRPLIQQWVFRFY